MAPSLSGSGQTRSRPWWRSAQRSRDRRGKSGARRQLEAADLGLVLRAQRGDRREREKLVDAHLPMIAGVAHAYRRSTAVSREELIQEGVVGLLRALERYDADRGVPFWGYAAWWVRQAMQEVVSELSGPIVLSDRALRQLSRIKNAGCRFEQAHRRAPSSGELAMISGLPRSQVESLLCAKRAARSLDAPAIGEGGEGATVGESISDPPAQEAYDRVPQGVLAAHIPDLLGCLTDRERTVICCRYGLGRPEQTLREVAPVFGVSMERVRQIEQESLVKMHAAAAGSARRREDRGVRRRVTSCARA